MTDEESSRWGQVRASPSGACLTFSRSETWHQWRKHHFQPLQFPKEGFEHIYGQEIMEQVDARPLGHSKKGLYEEEEEEKKDGRDYGSTKTPGTS
jgi:hypothetical protein